MGLVAWENPRRADLLLDCTGSNHQPNVLGDGGIPRVLRVGYEQVDEVAHSSPR
ncbi:MAG TPA: hypothetical protein VJS67_09235 [Pseudonocardiaceae bacterium]|nr:hypothetical protein [Pseudonocardiaceae bacterium]